MATPPDFSAGAVLTAAQMNLAGMWRINTCTVSSTGGTAATASDGVITIGTGNTTVTVSNAFSADFNAYRIIWTGGTANALTAIGIQLGATATAYYGARTATTTGGAAAFLGDNNTTIWTVPAVANASWGFIDVTLYGPFATTRTGIHSVYIEGTGALGTYVGYQDSNTSFTSFVLDPTGANTLTGGTLRVYGIIT